MNIRKTATFVVLFATIAASAVVIALFSESQIKSIEDRIIQEKTSEVEILSSRSMLRLNDSATMLKITANLDDVKSTPAYEIIEELHGIAEDSDPERRAVARSILENHPDFVRIGFVVPNGDMYMLEPFEFQKNFTRNNFSDRDYFQGAISTKDAYLSEVIRSAATGQNVAIISVPVYSQSDELVGVWLGTLNLETISERLSELDPGPNGRFVYVDKSGTKVADSVSENLGNEETFANLQAFKNGVAGQNGYSIENIDGKKMFIAYYPVNMLSNTWVVLLIQPYEDAFQPVTAARNQSLVIIFTIVGIGAVFAAYLYRSYSAIGKLISDLEKSNLQLKSKDEELEKSNNELVAVQRAKEEFITMISHELKTPLTPIKWYTELLLRRPTTASGELDEKHKKVAERLLWNASRLESLIQDVLDVYKLDMGKMRLSKVQIDIVKLINEIVSDARSLAMEKQVEITTEITAKGSVVCDPKRIEQVITNLIKNSVDFVPNDGKGRIAIRVEDGKEDSTILFSIEDNGSGIPPEKADLLFQKFYQVDTSITRKHGGTGLGLAICKGIIESHGGKIWIDKTYSNGARVKFTLPRGEQKNNESSGY